MYVRGRALETLELISIKSFTLSMEAWKGIKRYLILVVNLVFYHAIYKSFLFKTNIINIFEIILIEIIFEIL